MLSLHQTAQIPPMGHNCLKHCVNIWMPWTRYTLAIAFWPTYSAFVVKESAGQAMYRLSVTWMGSVLMIQGRCTLGVMCQSEGPSVALCERQKSGPVGWTHALFEKTICHLTKIKLWTSHILSETATSAPKIWWINVQAELNWIALHFLTTKLFHTR